MSRGRPVSPNSYVVDLNKVIDVVYEQTKHTTKPMNFYTTDVDIVIPVWELLNNDTAKHIIWLLNNGIYYSSKSRYVEYLEAKRGENGRDRFYIYDKFKTTSYSYKNGYKQLTVKVPYPEEDVEPIYLPVYWRVN